MRARYSTSRDMQDLCIAARRAGWRVEQTGGDHIRLTAPNGEFVFASQTPSDWRAVHATRARMNRSWPGWDGSEKREPRQREKRPGRAPVWRGAYQWDGRPGTDEQPLGATLGDLWPR